MAEEFEDGPTYIERSLSAPTMSVYDSFQDFLPTSRLNSKYNPHSTTTNTATTNSNPSSHFNVQNNTDDSYLAALTDLDILDDSHVAQIKSLVIDPKSKSFEFIQGDFHSTTSPLFASDEKPNSPSLQADETDELADVLTGIDQTTLSFQDLYVNDEDSHSSNYKRPSNDSTSFSSQIQSNSHQNSSAYPYSNQNSSKSANPLYSPSSSIYPTLSPTEGDIRGNAPPFTLGTPGGGYQGIQAYQSQNPQSNSQSSEGIYSSSTSDSYGNNASQQTAQSGSGQYGHLDMASGMAGAHVDPQLMHAMNGYYMANPQQGMFPEYFMAAQGYVPVMSQGQEENGQMYPAGSDGVNYVAFPGAQGQQQMYWAPYGTPQALQQQYQHQQLLMMQSMYQQGDYSGLQAAMAAQPMMYGNMQAMSMNMNGGNSIYPANITQQGGSTPVFMGNQSQMANGGMMPMMGQQGAQFPDRSNGGFVLPNGMVVPFNPAYPMDSFATAMMGQQMMSNGFPLMSRDSSDSSGQAGAMSSHPSLNNLHRANNQDRRNQISRVNSTGRLNNNNPSNSNLLSLNGPSRDALVEDFRNTYGKGRQWEIKDLIGHIVAFCQDQHGSRFIQQRLEVASPVDKQIVFDEVISNAQILITDVFGNYVIQKLFEFGSPEQCETLAALLTGQAVNLALQMYGCRVIQKALEYVQTPRLLFLVGEFEGQQVLKCVHDQNGNHVIQKCIEVMSRVAKSSPPETADFLNSRIQYIIHSFQGRVKELSMHPYGCRVVQRILEHCTNEQKGPVLEELRVCCRELIQDQYGNYVIQHMIQHGWETDQAVLMKEVHSKLLEYSQHKFASNVVEKCIQYADKQNRDEMIWTIINVTFDLNNPVDAKTGQCVLENMVRDPYANYVVQKVIDVSNETQRGAISRYVRENIVQLRRYTYGKHIIVRLERVSGEKF